ncbi:hypothetical protein V8C26DRAFT_363989 [Trichoderma gracile]
MGRRGAFGGNIEPTHLAMLLSICCMFGTSLSCETGEVVLRRDKVSALVIGMAFYLSFFLSPADPPHAQFHPEAQDRRGGDQLGPLIRLHVRKNVAMVMASPRETSPTVWVFERVKCLPGRVVTGKLQRSSQRLSRLIFQRCHDDTTV